MDADAERESDGRTERGIAETNGGGTEGHPYSQTFGNVVEGNREHEQHAALPGAFEALGGFVARVKMGKNFIHREKENATGKETERGRHPNRDALAGR